MVTVVDEAFLAGKSFIKNYNRSITDLDNDLRDLYSTRTRHDICKSGSDDRSSSIQSNGKISEIYRQIEELNKDNMRPPEETIEGTKDSTKSGRDVKNKTQPIDTTKVNWWEHEVLQFMRGMMDECTHLKNFSVPYDTSLITAVFTLYFHTKKSFYVIYVLTDFIVVLTANG